MRIRLLSLFCILFLLQTPVWSQTTTPTDLQTSIDALPWSNGQNLVTGADIQSLFDTVTQVFLTWAAPIDSPNFTGTGSIPSGWTLSTPLLLVLTNATGLPVSGLAPITTGVIGYAGAGTGTPVILTTLPSNLTIPSPALTGSPTAPTQSQGDASTLIATDGFVTNAVATQNSGTLTFNTKAQFAGAGTIPASVNYVTVNAVTGTYPPASGATATSLTYLRVGSSTGLYGEVQVGGSYFDPIYSTYPIKFAEWGLVSDATFSRNGGLINSVTCNGTTTATLASTTGVASLVGLNVATVNYATQTAASLPILPTNTILQSFILNTSITFSQVCPTGTMNLVAYNLVMNGTDNQPAFQAALNFGLQYGYPDYECATGGQYLLNDTLTAGWGQGSTGIAEVRINGGQRESFAGVYKGCTFYFPKTNRPALNLQGLRYASVKGITLVGDNFNYVIYSEGKANISSNVSDWLAPELVPAGGSSGGLTIHTPLVGIAIDAHSGTTPSPTYPTLTFPTFITTQCSCAPSQYGQAASSDTLIEDVEIDGFPVEVANGLNISSNGDFTKLNRVGFYGSIYEIGVWENQARNVLLSNINGNIDYIFLDTIALGEQGGEFNGIISNIAHSGQYQYFNIGLDLSGPIIADSLYCETCVRFGNLVGGSSFLSEVMIRGGILNFSDGIHGQIPSSYWTVTGAAQILMDGVTLLGNARISNFVTGGTVSLNLRGGNYQGATLSGTTAPLQQAVNYTGSILAGSSRFSANGAITNFFHIDANAFMTYYTGTSFGSYAYNDTLATYLARSPMTQAGRYYIDTQGRNWRLTVPSERVVTFTDTTQVGIAPSYSADVMTFGYCAASQTGGTLRAAVAGDIIYHITTGTIFVITTVTGPISNANCTNVYTVTTQQQNNITVTPGSNTFVSNLNSPANQLLPGSSVLIQTGAVIPQVLEYGTFSSSANTLATVSRGDGTTGGAFQTYYASGDPMFGPQFGTTYQPWPVGSTGNSLTGVTNGSPGSGTMTNNGTVSGIFPIFPYEIR